MTDDSDPTVLVVDDEEALADLYAQLLSIEYNVRTATTGSEALEKADETVDVALLDRRMPDMSGGEVLEKLRDRGLNCRIGMLSAVEPTGEIVDMPFDDYKLKPISEEELHSLVEVLLKRATYDAQSREFFRLASKKATLETNDNTDTEEYRQLVETLEDLREDIDATLDSVSAEGFFNDLSGPER